MGAAGPPEVVGESVVQVVPHPDDEGLEQRTGVASGLGQGREHTAADARPEPLEPRRRPQRDDGGSVHERGARRERVRPGPEPDARVLNAASHLHGYGLPPDGPPASGIGALGGARVDGKATGGGSARAVRADGRRQLELPRGHAARGQPRIRRDAPFVGDGAKPGRRGEARTEAHRYRLRAAVRHGAEAQADRSRGREEGGAKAPRAGQAHRRPTIFKKEKRYGEEPRRRARGQRPRERTGRKVYGDGHAGG